MVDTSPTVGPLLCVHVLYYENQTDQRKYFCLLALSNRNFRLFSDFPLGKPKFKLGMSRLYYFGEYLVNS